MRKISFLLIFALILGSMPMRADEGMWILPLLEKLNIKKMQDLGVKLTAEEIYSINHSSLKDAIVHFGGGCTAEVVSDKGLLFTNHHCGYGSIQKLSTVEHDYLNNGYWAMNLQEELPADGLSVTFIDKFTDVTARIEKALAKAKDEKDKEARYEKEVKAITKEALANDKTLDADVSSFYNGNAYYLITTRTYKDIRFVGAPPSSIGKFGADTDNWMWPRHTGDFSVFRIYADKNNNPAKYSADNVPYTPKQSLTVSLKGVKPNDYAMIIGFPGRTTRFMTSEEAKETQHINNAISIYTRGIKQDIWMNDMQADPKVRIQYSSKYAGSSNGWKKWIGMNETFDKLKVVERRMADEVKFTQWVNADPQRIAKYGKALDKINTAVKNRAAATYNSRYLNETLNSIEIARMANPRYATRYEAFYKDYSMPLDKKLAKEMIKIYKEKAAKEYLPSFYGIIDSNFGGDINKYVDNLYATSVYSDINKYKAAIDSKADLSTDPVNVVVNSVKEVILKLTPLLNADVNSYWDGKKEYVAGILEMRGNDAMYPDANSTMRLTYGQILPYSPRDAVEYDYVTTLDGVIQKEDPNNWEFVVPAKLKELYKAKDFTNAKYGTYALENGKMPVAFLSNNDITGGNSGSPVLNAKGELLGLAFDGNWEAMSGDVIFEPSLQRCINVDVRYVLFIIDKFGGAGYLLDEMKIAR
ncbi:MAG: S46 family peptidase [Bacteroidales bacterium]